MTQLTVSVEDASMLDQIKQAISLLRGVSSVTLKRRRKTSMERAIEDIEQGRVYKYDSLDDLIKEIEKTNFPDDIFRNMSFTMRTIRM